MIEKIKEETGQHWHATYYESHNCRIKVVEGIGEFAGIGDTIVKHRNVLYAPKVSVLEGTVVVILEGRSSWDRSGRRYSAWKMSGTAWKR